MIDSQIMYYTGSRHFFFKYYMSSYKYGSDVYGSDCVHNNYLYRFIKSFG